MSDMLHQLVVPGPKQSAANLNDKLMKHIGHFYSMPAAIASA